MTTAKLTLTNIKSLKPNSILWDSEVRGFGARRQTADGVYFVLKKRVNGKSRWMTIGRLGSPWTLDKARQEAKRLMYAIASGEDPTAKKREQQRAEADTLKSVIERYLKASEARLKPRPFKERTRYLMEDWEPFHSTPITLITRKMVAEQVNQLTGDRSATVALKARAALSGLFTWAQGEGHEVSNPVTGSNVPVTNGPRDRVLSELELKTLWEVTALPTVLDPMQQTTLNHVELDSWGRYCKIVRLLMLTGLRRDEIGMLRWSEINFENQLMTIPGSRTKNGEEHKVPMSLPVMEILASIPTNGDKVFNFTNWSNSFAKLLKLLNGAILEQWVIHDIRRSVDTQLHELLVPPQIVEAITGHKGHKAGIAGVYNKAQYLEPMRKALDMWANHLINL